MPSFIVSITFEKGSNIFVNPLSDCNVHRLVCLWWDPIQAWTFAILQFVDGSIDFVKGDGGVDFVKNWTLGDFIKNGRINRTVVVENSLKVGTKHGHIFLVISCRFAICHFHCHFHFLLVMSS